MNARGFPLTRRQADLLRFIAGYQRAHSGRSPSQQEMAAGIGVVSRAYVQELLCALAERGHLDRERHRARSLRLLTDISIPAAPDGAPLFAVPLPRQGVSA